MYHYILEVKLSVESTLACWDKWIYFCLHYLSCIVKGKCGHG